MRANIIHISGWKEEKMISRPFRLSYTTFNTTGVNTYTRLRVEGIVGAGGNIFEGECGGIPVSTHQFNSTFR